MDYPFCAVIASKSLRATRCCAKSRMNLSSGVRFALSVAFGVICPDRVMTSGARR